jgi:hypothetical protein
MRIGHSMLALHSALSHALVKDLPAISGTTRDWTAWRQMTPAQQREAIQSGTEPTLSFERRPMDDEVKVRMWPQTWGSTALGYGGMGGAAVSDAYTVVVTFRGTHCVYFGDSGQLAYTVNQSAITSEQLANWQHDQAQSRLVSRAESKERYGATTLC